MLPVGGEHVGNSWLGSSEPSKGLRLEAPVRMQPCDALSGQGVLEGLDFLTTVAKGELGLTIADAQFKLQNGSIVGQ